MNDEQKQIEEMAKAMSDFELEDSARCDIELSKHLIAKGYRKQSDTAREIAEMLKAAKAVVKVHFEAYDELIENIAAEYGVEVEEL